MEIKNKIIKTELIRWKNVKWFQNDGLKKLDAENMLKLKRSLVNNNFVMPFHVWENDGELYFLDGHQREKARRELEQFGFDNQPIKIPDLLPANFIDATDREEAAKLVLIYSSLYARITEDGLTEFFKANKLDLNVISTEISLPEIKLNHIILNDIPEEQLDDVPAPAKKPLSKLADVFVLDGKHHVMCGDSTKKEDVELLMDGKKADMVFTDPPYNIGYDYWDYIDKKDSNEYYRMMLQSLCSLCDRIVITTGHQNMGLWFSIAKPTHVASWVKRNATSGCKISMFNIWEPIFFYGDFKKFRKRENDVFEVNNTNQKFVEGHSCPKQVNLLSDIVTNYSHIKEVVLDIFLGSGSTLIACEQTNRICYGMEIDPIYIDVILRRYHNLYPDKKIECLNRSFNFEKLWKSE